MTGGARGARCPPDDVDDGSHVATAILLVGFADDVGKDQDVSVDERCDRHRDHVGVQGRIDQGWRWQQRKRAATRARWHSTWRSPNSTGRCGEAPVPAARHLHDQCIERRERFLEPGMFAAY